VHASGLFHKEPMSTPSLLTADQIQTLRVEWLDDYIDLRPEWGTPLAASASKGAAALTLSGLASTGTLRSGTRFGLVHNGQAMAYYLTADATITAGAATIAFGPPLIAAVLSNAPVTPEPRYKSLYNKRTGRLFWSDPDLQDLADRVSRLRARFIRSADDPDLMLFRAIRYYGWTAMLSSDEFLLGTDKSVVAAKQAQVAQDHGIIFADQTGPQNVRFVR
jgi:hypothetical protein